MAWKAAGIHKGIPRASVERWSFIEIGQQQMAVCRDGGLRLDAYPWCYFDEDWPIEEQMALVLHHYGQYPVERWWLDLEDATDWEAARVIDWIRRAVRVLGEQQCGLYTREGWWAQYTGNSREFGQLPLLDAYHDGLASLENNIVQGKQVVFQGYGPWDFREGRWGKQYEANASLGAVTVDLDVLRG